MALIPNSIRVTGFIAPSDSTDTFATHDSKYGRGGLTEVADLTERDAITADRRREGMVVYVASDGQTYQLVGGVTNGDWTIFGNAAATLGSYVITVNGISGAVQLTPGDGIGINSGLTFSVTGDYAFNSTVREASGNAYAYTLASVQEASGNSYAFTTASVDAANASTLTLVQTASGNSYAFTTASVQEASGNSYAFTTASVNAANASTLTLVQEASGNAYAFTTASVQAASGNLMAYTDTISAMAESNFVHKLTSGPASETIYNEKIFADTTTFNQDLVVQGAIFAASGVFAVYAESVSAFDNMIELNVGDPGPGVTRGFAGVQVNRGSSVPYQFLFDENRNAFVIGTIDGPVTADGGPAMISELQSVATREDNPTDQGIAVWTEAGDGSISPSGAFKFITNSQFTYDSVTGLSTNAIVYTPTTPADWSTAPAEVFQALDTLAADLTLASGDLTGLIVATSGALHSEMVQTSGNLVTLIQTTSGNAYAYTLASVQEASGNTYAFATTSVQEASGNSYAFTTASVQEASGNAYAFTTASIDAANASTLTLVQTASGNAYAFTTASVQEASGNAYAYTLASVQEASGNSYAFTTASIDAANASTLTLVQTASGNAYAFTTASVQAASANLMAYTDVSVQSASANAYAYTDAVSAAIVSNVVNMFEGGTISCSTTAYGYTINHKTLNAISDAFPIVSLSVPTSSSVLYVQGITERSVSGFKVILSDVPDVAGFEINWVLFKPYFTTLP